MNINQIIELVEKWIADPESVSRKELKAASASAYAAAWSTYGDAAWYVTAVYATRNALCDDIDGAKHWVAEYYRRTKGNVR